MSNRDMPVVVTTEHRGVFFGYVDGDELKRIMRGEPWDRSLVLEKMRMCVSWTSDIRGVLGLASAGPSDTCRVSDAAPENRLTDITWVGTVTREAAERWEAGPWA